MIAVSNLLRLIDLLSWCHFSAHRLLSNHELSKPRDGASDQERHRELVLARVRALIHFHTENEVCSKCAMLKNKIISTCALRSGVCAGKPEFKIFNKILNFNKHYFKSPRQITSCDKH